MATPSHDNNLAEKEFLLIQELARKPTSTQRDLSETLELSLGMTNLLIKRLSRKGLIKITQLDWKRTQYLLTLKGAVEKTRKAFSYTLYTLKIFRQIKENINTAIGREYKAGRRQFYLVAQDEILDLTKETVAGLGLPDASFTFLRTFSEAPSDCDVIFTATLDESPAEPASRRYVSLVDFDNISFRL
jgi:DNA-binding MarR family transcriptional regulator